MAIVLVQNTGAVAGARAFVSNNTAGNLLICCTQSTANPTTVTDSAGNTWAKAIGIDDFQYAEIWYAMNCAAGANTVTVNGLTFGNIWIAEYSGIELTGALDKTAGAIGSGSNHTAVNSGNTATTSQADELLICCAANFGGQPYAWTSPLTERYEGTAPGSRVMGTADQIVSATGTYAALATMGGATILDHALIATFKAASGGGGGNRRRRVICGVAV